MHRYCAEGLLSRTTAVFIEVQCTLKCNTLKGKAFVSLSICLVNSTEPRGSIAAYVHDARAKIYGTLHATTTTALELAQRCEEENTTSVGLCVCVNVGGVVRIRVRTMQPASKQAKKKTGRLTSHSSRHILDVTRACKCDPNRCTFVRRESLACVQRHASPRCVVPIAKVGNNKPQKERVCQ